MSDYVEMSLKDAISFFPALLPIVKAAGISLDDTNYIVRFTKDFQLEIGYRSDSWAIG